jgi:beta-galactosidase
MHKLRIIFLKVRTYVLKLIMVDLIFKLFNQFIYKNNNNAFLGGLPWWLLSDGPENVVPRTKEENYMNAVRRYLHVLLPKLTPYLYANGGPIITVQVFFLSPIIQPIYEAYLGKHNLFFKVENEYGFYYACDMEYKTQLRDIFRQHLGDDVVYFTTDPGYVLQCGHIPGVYATVDFGVEVDPNDAFANQRKFSPQGPLVNSEFYPGWLDFWGSPHSTRPTSEIVSRLDQMLAMGANVNFYMFFGGTNFGFTNGMEFFY